MGMKTSGGDIIPVQGGHVLRSTGRKDRHSKVYTSKGPRDRRVRLAAHTAIQFYDVQDRLGYDRPSKAVDWLIKKAKSAIDKLTELPPWHPVPTTAPMSDLRVPKETGPLRYDSQGQLEKNSINNNNNSNNNNNTLTSFVPPQMESDPLIDSMKSFFPTGNSTNSAVEFSTFPPGIFSRTVEQRQDLGLSLHTFQDTGLIHHGTNSSNNTNITSNNEAVYPSPLGFEANYQKIMSWGNGEQLAVAEQEGTVTHGIGSGSVLGSGSGSGSSPSLGFLRGTLQSSFAYDDVAMAMPMPLQGFRIPTRIQGTDEEEEEEEHQHQFVSERPSCSTSPNSGH